MKFTNHFLEKYTCRHLGITDAKEIKRYVIQNREKLIRHCSNLAKNAVWVWRGQLPQLKNPSELNSTSNFLVRDNMVLIADPDINKKLFITFYYANFGEGKNSRVIARNLTKKMLELQGQLTNVKAILGRAEGEEKKKALSDVVSIEGRLYDMACRFFHAGFQAESHDLSEKAEETAG
jgi:hypothetical protein